MSENSAQDHDRLFQKSALYQEFLAEREEILRHKWIESEKAGHDIGFEKALLDWIVKHRAGWRSLRHQKPQTQGNDRPNHVVAA
ncbi:MAG: DUF4032 domain-containing protein [Methylacidiphilales bacterium]|nr:DUF4032 domain-containing protein [Candidatus Methylacidiphilales bacterium]